MKIVINQILLLLIFSFVSACSGNDAEVSNAGSANSQEKSNQEKANQQNNYRIGTYFSPDRKLSGNSYWVEGPDGLVLIDTQFHVQDTLELLQIAESITGKKVKMAIILQPTAQSFNGVAALVSRGIQVVSSSQVVDAIPRVDKESREKWQADYADYPAETVLPEARWDKTQEFDAVGLRFKAYVVRGVVSESHLLIGIEDSLFVGDIVMQGEHVAFSSVSLQRRLERIEEIRKFVNPIVIYPGKGYAMGGDDLLKQQQDYLENFDKVISEYYTGGKISQADVRDIIRKIKQQYPRFKNTHLLEKSVISAWDAKRQLDHQMFNWLLIYAQAILR